MALTPTRGENTSRQTLSPGQLIHVIMPMEAYPHRATTAEDFHDLLFGNNNLLFEQGSILTIISSSPPTFLRDDTWYLASSPRGSTVWLIDAHHGIYYDTI